MKPITPKEAAKSKETLIPQEVVAAVNSVLASRFTDSRAGIKITLKEIVDLAREKFEQNGKEPPSAQSFYDNKWLDIEPIYKKAGWTVVFDKPAFNENYAANFIFTITKG